MLDAISKLRAIDRLAMGTLDKLYLMFDQPFWPTHPTWLTLPDTDLPRGQLNEWMNLYPYLDAPILLAFTGGPPAHAMAGRSDSALVSAALVALQRAF